MASSTSLYKSSRLIDDASFVERLRSILEFSHYIQYLPPDERGIASSIDFKPGDSLLAFGAKITKKLRQVLKLSVNSTTAPVALIRQQPSASLTCTFCSRKGHSERNCYRRKRMASKASSTPDVSGSSSPSHRPNASQANRSPPSLSSHTTYSTAPIKRRDIHGACNHITDECFKVLRLKQCHDTSRLGKSSGEDSRTVQKPQINPVIPSQQQHTPSAIPALVAACSSTPMIRVKIML